MARFALTSGALSRAYNACQTHAVVFA
jgi:hypothetical protein